MTTKDLMLTIDADVHSSLRTGYLQINQAGVQKLHSDRINGAMFNKFNDFDLFVNLTELD
ncbi:hypothetical protein EMIT0P265_250006 [Pseudomonas zeae]